MNKYPRYKLTGIEWIDDDASTSSARGIPEEWKIKKIKHLCYVKGRVGWKGLKASEFLIKGFAYLVTGTDFKDGLVDWENCYQIDEERYLEDAYIQLRNDDLLITKDGTIGKLAIVENLNKPACLNSGIFVVRSLIDNFSTRYLYWILRSPVFSSYNNYTSYGSTIQHLYQNVFVEFNFCFPMYDEQTAIANYLDDKTAKIDTLIEKKKKLIELLKEERTAVINQAVTRGLPAEAAAKAGIKPNVKLKDSGIDWLGYIPAHWEVKKLKYVGNIVLGKMLTNDDKGGYHLKPYLRAANLQWFDVNVDDVKEMWFSEAELAKLRIKEFDLLVSEGGEVGRTCIWRNELDECFIQNSVHKITINKDNNPVFFLYLLFSIGNIGFFESIVNRISIAHLTGEKIKDVPVWCPPIYEQNRIVQHIETETKRIDGTISKTEKEIELLAEYRTALISEVVTGKIKVI